MSPLLWQLRFYRRSWRSDHSYQKTQEGCGWRSRSLGGENPEHSGKRVRFSSIHFPCRKVPPKPWQGQHLVLPDNFSSSVEIRRETPSSKENRTATAFSSFSFYIPAKLRMAHLQNGIGTTNILRKMLRNLPDMFGALSLRFQKCPAISPIMNRM